LWARTCENARLPRRTGILTGAPDHTSTGRRGDGIPGSARRGGSHRQSAERRRGNSKSTGNAERPHLPGRRQGKRTDRRHDHRRRETPRGPARRAARPVAGAGGPPVRGPRPRRSRPEDLHRERWARSADRARRQWPDRQRSSLPRTTKPRDSRTADPTLNRHPERSTIASRGGRSARASTQACRPAPGVIRCTPPPGSGPYERPVSRGRGRASRRPGGRTW
jgi:hypothetical protein